MESMDVLDGIGSVTIDRRHVLIPLVVGIGQTPADGPSLSRVLTPKDDSTHLFCNGGCSIRRESIADHEVQTRLLKVPDHRLDGLLFVVGRKADEQGGRNVIHYFIEVMKRPYHVVYGASVFTYPSIHSSYRDVAMDVLRGLGDLVHAFEDRTILITGACGFLGVHFVEALRLFNEQCAMPCRILALDDLTRDGECIEQTWTADAQIRFLKRDVQDELDLDEVDYVIHAASIASPIAYRRQPIRTMEANVLGTWNLLRSCIGSTVRSMLFISSSEVYGNPPASAIPTPETHTGRVSFTGPRACYDESKRFGETLCVEHHRTAGVPVRIARPFNAYGPGLRPGDGRAISDFMRDALLDGSIRLLSNGSPTRTFCYVSDAIEGLFRALLIGRAGEAYNIGANGPEISMVDVARIIAALVEPHAKIQFAHSDDRDYLTDNPERRCPDTAKARRELSFEADVALEVGLQRSLAYYKVLL